jgi:hypothetical protein
MEGYQSHFAKHSSSFKYSLETVALACQVQCCRIERWEKVRLVVADFLLDGSFDANPHGPPQT